MIIAELANFLHKHNDDILKNKSTCSLLCSWLLSILKHKPINNVEKIIHTEIALAENKYGEFMLVAKSPSGQKLTYALYDFAMMYEQELMRKWLNQQKPNDFKNK